MREIEILPRNIIPDIPPLPTHWRKGEYKPIKEDVNLFTDIFVKKQQVVFISTPTEKKNSWIYLYEMYQHYTIHHRPNNSLFIGVDCS